jgi:hypothetical protein
MPGNEWDANYRSGRDNPNYSPYHTPDGVTDAGAYHTGGKSIGSWGSWRSNLGLDKPASTAFRSSSSSGQGDAGGIFLLLLILPPLVPPGILLYATWLYLDGRNLDTWYKVGALVAEIAAISFCISLFYRFVPKILAAFITAAYMAVTYGAATAYANFSDLWSGVVIVVAGTAGYFMGVSLSKRHGYPVFELPMEIGSLLLGAVVWSNGHVYAVSQSAPGWVVKAAPWWGATLMAIGACALIARFPLVFLVAAAGCGFLWFEHPDVLHQFLAQIH